MRKSILYLCLLFLFVGNSYSKRESTFIVSGEGTELTGAAEELSEYLSKTYPKENFSLVEKAQSGKRNILLEVDSEEKLESDEAFEISGGRNQLHITGKTPRAVKNGVFGLLKEIGWN